MYKRSSRCQNSRRSSTSHQSDEELQADEGSAAGITAGSISVDMSRLSSRICSRPLPTQNFRLSPQFRETSPSSQPPDVPPPSYEDSLSYPNTEEQERDPPPSYDDSGPPTDNGRHDDQ